MYLHVRCPEPECHSAALYPADAMKWAQKMSEAEGCCCITGFYKAKAAEAVLGRDELLLSNRRQHPHTGICAGTWVLAAYASMVLSMHAPMWPS